MRRIARKLYRFTSCGIGLASSKGVSRSRDRTKEVTVKQLLLVTSLFILPLSTGCQDSPESRKANQEAQREINEATRATGDAVAVQKREYRKKMESELE